MFTSNKTPNEQLYLPLLTAQAASNKKVKNPISHLEEKKIIYKKHVKSLQNILSDPENKDDEDVKFTLKHFKKKLGKINMQIAEYNYQLMGGNDFIEHPPSDDEEDVMQSRSCTIL